MDSSAEFQLLFGLLALQNNLISRQQLVSAFSEWIVDKQRRLADLLKSQGSLDETTAQLIRSLAERHIERNGGAIAESLAQLPLPAECREQLATLSDADLEASLVQHGSLRPPSEQPESIHATATIAHVAANDSSRFRFLRPHAEGGLGRVSVAFDHELHREVALKEIKERFADDIDSRSRFLREAEITGALEHPGIVPVYGLGQYRDGRPFYAMRMIRGSSMKEAIDRFYEHRLKSKPGDDEVEFRRLLQRLVVVCDTLEFAHSRKVLHRDIKPGNIMLGKYGETLIVDWGLAKSLSAPNGERSSDSESNSIGTIAPTNSAGRAANVHDTAERGDSTWHPRGSSGNEPTQMGSAIGTPAFMSPEQAAGRLDQLSPASDVYSIGATLYYLLTGRAPFGDSDLGSILKRVQDGDFPPPRNLRPGIPAALEAICLRAMKTTPEARYESASALARDLERYLADEPVTALAKRWQAEVSRWGRRHRSWVWAGVWTLGGLCIALVATIIVTHREREQTREHLRESLLQSASSLAGVQLSHPIGWRDRTLRAVKDAVAIRPGVDLRNVALTALLGEDRELLREFKLPEDARSVVISTDDRICSFLCGDTLQLYHFQTGKLAFEVGGFSNQPLCQTFLGEADLLACGLKSGSIELVDTKSGRVVSTLKLPAGVAAQPCLAAAHGPEPDLVTTCDAKGVRVWNFKTRKQVTEAEYQPLEAAPAAEAAPAVEGTPSANNGDAGPPGNPGNVGDARQSSALELKELQKLKRSKLGSPPLATEPEDQVPASVDNPAEIHVAFAVSLSQKRVAMAPAFASTQVWQYQEGKLTPVLVARPYVQNRARLAFVGNDYLFVAYDDGPSHSDGTQMRVAPAAELPDAPPPPAPPQPPPLPQSDAAPPTEPEAASNKSAKVTVGAIHFVSQPDLGPTEPLDVGPFQPLDIGPTQPLDSSSFDSPSLNALDAISRVLDRISVPAEAIVQSGLNSSPTGLLNDRLPFDPHFVTAEIVNLNTGQSSEPLRFPLGKLQAVFHDGDNLGLLTHEGIVLGLEPKLPSIMPRWYWILSRGDVAAGISPTTPHQLLVARRGGETQLWRRRLTPHRTVLLSRHDYKCFLDWDSQEQLLVDVPWNYSPRLLRVSRNEYHASLPLELHRVDGVEWQAGDKRLFILSEFGLIQAFSPQELFPIPETTLAPIEQFQLPLSAPCKAWSICLGASNRVAVLSDNGQVGLLRWGPDPKIEHNLVRDGVIIRSMSFSPDGLHLATGDDAGNVVIWSTTTGKSVAEFPFEVSINAVSYVDDGKLLYVLTSRPELVVCDATSGVRLLTTPLLNQATQIAANDRLLACGCLDGRLLLCKRSTGEIVAQWQGHANEVKRIKWGPQGSLMTASTYGEVVRWDVPGMREDLAELGLDWVD